MGVAVNKPEGSTEGKGDVSTKDLPQVKDAGNEKPVGAKTVRTKKDPNADGPILRFNGPARSYMFHGIKFLKTESRHVKPSDEKKLLETGFFSRASEVGVLDTDAPQRKLKDRAPQYQVGHFDTKNEALTYAKKVHGVELSPALSLRQLNLRTLDLAKAADNAEKGTEEGVEMV